MKRTRDSARNGWFWLAGLAAFGWLVYLLTPMLSPFVAGAVLAYEALAHLNPPKPVR